MGFSNFRVSAQEQEEIIKVNLTGPNVAKLIGKTNATANTDVIESLQLMVTKAVFPRNTQIKNVVLDVNGFRTERSKMLQSAVERTIKYVQTSNKTLRFITMNVFDRRAFHTVLQKQTEKDTHSESEGLGIFRQLHVKKIRRKR